MIAVQTHRPQCWWLSVLFLSFIDRQHRRCWPMLSSSRWVSPPSGALLVLLTWNEWPLTLNSVPCSSWVLLFCDRWRGTPETPSSASCTQQCPSPAPRTLQYPALPPRPATLQHQPPPTPLRLCGTSNLPILRILTSKPNPRQSKQSNEAKFYCAFIILSFTRLSEPFFFKVVL